MFSYIGKLAKILNLESVMTSNELPVIVLNSYWLFNILSISLLCKLSSRKEICLWSTVLKMNLLCFKFCYGGLNLHFKKRLRKINLFSKRLIKGTDLSVFLTSQMQ